MPLFDIYIKPELAQDVSLMLYCLPDVSLTQHGLLDSGYFNFFGSMSSRSFLIIQKEFEPDIFINEYPPEIEAKLGKKWSDP